MHCGLTHWDLRDASWQPVLDLGAEVLFSFSWRWLISPVRVWNQARQWHQDSGPTTLHRPPIPSVQLRFTISA